MKEELYHLTYHSISRSGLGYKDLDRILKKAISANAARDISGCLIHHQDRFVQILEGSKKDVRQVYKKIKGDSDHHHVTLLWSNHVENRFFSEWNMAFHRPDDENIKHFINNLTLLAELSDIHSPSLLSFWAKVRKILTNGSHSPFVK